MAARTASQAARQSTKKFQCPLCTVKLSNSGQFKGHMRIHTGERPFKCDQPFCQKTFTRNEELTRHKRIHTGQRPYACATCNKCFGRKDHLKKHTKTHENQRRNRLEQQRRLGMSSVNVEEYNLNSDWNRGLRGRQEEAEVKEEGEIEVETSVAASPASHQSSSSSASSSVFSSASSSTSAATLAMAPAASQVFGAASPQSCPSAAGLSPQTVPVSTNHFSHQQACAMVPSQAGAGVVSPHSQPAAVPLQQAAAGAYPANLLIGNPLQATYPFAPADSVFAWQLAQLAAQMNQQHQHQQLQQQLRLHQQQPIIDALALQHLQYARQQQLTEQQLDLMYQLGSLRQ